MQWKYMKTSIGHVVCIITWEYRRLACSALTLLYQECMHFRPLAVQTGLSVLRTGSGVHHAIATELRDRGGR
eukprot:6150-Eustigmatos_ZCMA.PRE.1